MTPARTTTPYALADDGAHTYTRHEVESARASYTAPRRGRLHEIEREDRQPAIRGRRIA